MYVYCLDDILYFIFGIPSAGIYREKKFIPLINDNSLTNVVVVLIKSTQSSCMGNIPNASIMSLMSSSAIPEKNCWESIIACRWYSGSESSSAAIVYLPLMRVAEIPLMSSSWMTVALLLMPAKIAQVCVRIDRIQIIEIDIG